MRNPEKKENRGLLSPKALFESSASLRWAGLPDDVGRYFNPYIGLAHYNDKPDEKPRYPFVVASKNESIPTPSQRVRLRRQADLASQPSDIPDTEFFGYNPTGFSDGEGEGGGGPPPRAPTPPVPAETTSASTPVVVEADAEAVVVEEAKPKHRKAKGTAKTRGRAKAKPLGRECSRPEV